MNYFKPIPEIIRNQREGFRKIEKLRFVHHKTWNKHIIYIYVLYILYYIIIPTY